MDRFHGVNKTFSKLINFANILVLLTVIFGLSDLENIIWAKEAPVKEVIGDQDSVQKCESIAAKIDLSFDAGFAESLRKFPNCFKLLKGNLKWKTFDERRQEFKVRVLDGRRYDMSNQLINEMLELLAGIDPKDRELAPFKKKSEKEKKREAIALQKFQKKSESDYKKNLGIQIGMTKQDVIESSWGAPVSKNIDRYASGEIETWHYSMGSYLVFKNGFLSRISTSQ
jgi:hypothetical protein